MAVSAVWGEIPQHWRACSTPCQRHPNRPDPTRRPLPADPTRRPPRLRRRGSLRSAVSRHWTAPRRRPASVGLARSGRFVPVSRRAARTRLPAALSDPSGSGGVSTRPPVGRPWRRLCRSSRTVWTLLSGRLTRQAPDLVHRSARQPPLCSTALVRATERPWALV